MLLSDQTQGVNVAIQNRKEIVQIQYDFATNAQRVLEDQVKRGEYYTFQVILRSTQSDILDITIDTEDLTSGESVIENKNIVCFNQKKVDIQGTEFWEKLHLIKGEIKVLWFGVSIPEHQAVGDYVGNVTIKKGEVVLGQVALHLDVVEAVSSDHGLECLDTKARLFWMNSSKGLDHTITKGYMPIELEDEKIKLLGRAIQLDQMGLPHQIASYYNDQLEVVDYASNLLSSPIAFNIEMATGEKFACNEHFKIEAQSEDRIIWSNRLEDEQLRVDLRGQVQYDGWMQYSINVVAKQQVALRNTELRMVYPREMAKYILGLGLEGGTIPEHYEWKWDEKKHQDAVWIGNVNGGMKCHLKDNTYVAPLVNVYFNQRSLNPPKAWDNEGKGGILIRQENDEVCLSIYTGEYMLEGGEERNFGFEYLITPFKPIDYDKHWQTRYYHPNEHTKIGDEWIKTAQQEGCNYTIVHHGQQAHPFINYPFIEVDVLKGLTDQAHEKNIGLKVYYTVREMTNHAEEFWPWYHLGLFPKASETEPVFWEGMKELWAQKVFGRKVIPAWEHEFKEGKYKGDICSALIVEPNSQVDNYYIEGLDWLVKEVGIDGIYIDDTSIGRETLRRARKILDQKENSLIDMHSWNHLNEHAGYANSGLIYMDLFPYIDSLWYGEGFDYDKPPEYWLVELTGIPYGLMGQMLEGGGNPYRGMLYGMTSRTGWGDKSAWPLYNLWDEFDIQQSKMYGYWSKECPVKTNDQQILATAYVKDHQAMIVLASWAEQKQEVKVEIDWKRIGLEKEKATISLPYIRGIQEEKQLDNLDQVKVSPKKGIFMIIS
ncbi:MAG: glycoside hydrolase domain-containing protein [Cellulosilyticaceae bacterium]